VQSDLSNGMPVSEKCPNENLRKTKKLKVTSQSYNHISHLTRKRIS